MIVGLTGGRLDRADRLRSDAAGYAAVTADWRARLLKLEGLDPVVEDGGTLAWTSLTEAPENAELILLGLDGDRPCFAALPAGGQPAPSRSPAIFRVLDALRPEEASIYAAARSLVDWHGRHRFCANCGTGTALFRAGWGRHCDGCGADHFPRVDPVVIMLTEHDGRALLGRQPRFPARRYSALAGFVEPGESIEEAVARETMEEAGIRVRDVRYVASQPWPFPSSLMIACLATAEDDRLTIDTTELEDAMWVPRAEVTAALAGDPDASFIAPPPYAIAHTLLATWAERGNN